MQNLLMRLKVFLFIRIYSFLFSLLILSSCNPSGTGSLFKKRSAHQVYAQRLQEAGLDKTAMGRSWLLEAESSLEKSVPVSIPYQEAGYFAAENVEAASFRFEAKRGEKLTITLKKKSAENMMIFMDLFSKQLNSKNADLIAFADTSGNPIKYDVDEAGFYFLRLQPELLKSGEYTLSITSGPSLAYPIKAPGKNHVKSVWGDSRDANSRKHEGIDLFAKFRTPVVAAAAGRITRVNTTNLGGKVVWLKPDGKNYTLYYAHLDTQLVQAGQLLEEGDILGLMGNTGNAKGTLPHLHFGIYTFGGAVDPLPFVNRKIELLADISASKEYLNTTLRTTSVNTQLYSSPNQKTMLRTLPAQTILVVKAASSNFYKVSLPNGESGYVSSQLVTAIYNPIRKITLLVSQPLLNKPDTTALHKTVLSSGKSLNILGSFQNYYLVNDQDNNTGWISK